jgi:GntR family transcriptional regulator/MocR family aminotransferase
MEITTIAKKETLMITISLDTNSSLPMYRQIYEYIKNEILSGALSYPEKLPSSRSLASFLQVSRTTVDTAYGQLVAEGYIESKEKRGFFVNSITHTTNFRLPASTVSTETGISGNTQFRYDFNPDAIDTVHFPYSVWKSLGKNELDNPKNFLIGDHLGEWPLRQAIAAYLHGSRGVFCSPENIVVGAGLDSLLQMLCLLFRGEAVVAVEDPGYRTARQIFLANGYSLTDIPLKNMTFPVDALVKSKADICYVTPSHQFPLGSVMSVRERQNLLSWAAGRKNRYIIEDDHDSEFRYKGKPIPALQSLDRGQKVIYIGSLSKAISPALRVGYMVLPDSLMDDYRQLSRIYACPVSMTSQAVLTSFIREGYFEKHLNRMRKIYKMKHDFMVEQIKKNFPASQIQISGDNAGLYVILRCLGTLSEEEIVCRAKKAGIRLYSLRDYYAVVPSGYLPAFLLGFAGLEKAQIESGITALADSLLLSPCPKKSASEAETD